jgi:hypothetical protein
MSSAASHGTAAKRSKSKAVGCELPEEDCFPAMCAVKYSPVVSSLDSGCHRSVESGGGSCRDGNLPETSLRRTRLASGFAGCAASFLTGPTNAGIARYDVLLGPRSLILTFPVSREHC